MRLSPVLVAIFAASTTFGFSKSANAQTSEATINADFIPISVNSTTQFAKLSLTKSSVEFGAIFPAQKFSEGMDNFYSKSWSDKPVKLDFYTSLNFPEIQERFILTKSLDSKSIYFSKSNKQVEQSLSLEVSGKTEIPQLNTLNKTVESKVEILAKKELTSGFNTAENIVTTTENSESLILAKRSETKPEILANKQFASGINTKLDSSTDTGKYPAVMLAKRDETKSEVLAQKFASGINTQENSESLILAKGEESKPEILANKQFASGINTPANSESLILAKGEETKPEILANKQFASGINTQENIVPTTENSAGVVLAKKGEETKPEILANKQFISGINTPADSESLILAKGEESKPEILVQKFASGINTPANSESLILAKGEETKPEILANKQFTSGINTQENIVPTTEKSAEVILAKKGEETKPEILAKQFASEINIEKNIAPARENSPAVILAKKGEETKPEILANKQFNTIIFENKEILINQKKFTSTLDSSNSVAQTSSPEEEVPEEPEEQFTPPSTQPTQPTQPTTGEAEPLVLVAEVVVIGVEGELEDEVYQVISTQPGRTTTRSQLQQDINAIFATGFFQNVKAVPKDTPLGVRVTFEVEPNPVLRSVEVQGSEELPDRVVQDIFSNQYGEILNLKVFEQSVEQLNKWYQDNGYVLAQVIGAPQVSEDGTVILEVAEGEIEDIQVRFLNADGETTDEEGNTIEGRTRKYIITREIELKPGDVFKRETAEKDIRRVFGLGIFEDVRLGLEPSPDDPNKAVVVVNVVEKSTGSLAFGGGISSASGLFGTVSYQQQNVGGNNQKLGGEFQVGERLLLADLSFTDPWVGGDDHRLSYTVNVFRRRAISVIFDEGERDVDLPNGDNPRVIRTGGGVSFTRPFIPNPFVDPQWTASLGAKYERVEIQDSDGDTEPRDELGNKLTADDSGEDDLLTIQFGIVNDRRNNPRTPTSGSLLRFGTEQSIPVGSGEIAFNRVRANYSLYFPIDLTNFAEGPEALAFNVQAGHILGDLPPYEAFPLGGTSTVRGYDEGELAAGRTFILGTVEYRFPLFNFLGGALFIDAATVFDSQSSVIGNPGGVREKPGDGIGYGAGIRVQSPLGPIRIDYAVNDEGDTRFHFGIGEKF